jgi:spermidine synthase
VRLSGWSACAVVFVASACTLALEIVAGRILAPYLGVSLYTWTSVIGVVLAGISLGSYLGGKLADRWASPYTLGLLLLTGGLSSLLILPLASLPTDRMLFRLPCQPEALDAFSLCTPLVVTVGRILALTAALFFLPGLVLGTVAPLTVRLALTDLRGSGQTVGALYAWSTLGSLVGAFVTGFWLISAVGTRPIVLGVGLVLLALALLVGQAWRLRRPVGALPILLGLALAGLLLNTIRQRAALTPPCTQETDYFCIKVYTQPIERDRPLTVLALDHLVHSYNALDDPTYYEYSYIRVYAEVADYVARQRPDFRSLFIGGGGYTLPRGFEAVYPAAEIEVIEIDPGVTRVVYERLGLSADTRIRTHNLDARLVLDQLQGGPSYDLVFGDAFNDLSVPYHLTTLEFDRKVRALLRDDGFYLVNVIDRFRGGQLLPAMVRTLQRVFPHVYVLSAGEPWLNLAASTNTYVLAATATPLDLERLRRVTPQGFGRNILSNVMPADLMADWLASTPDLVLTDDYAPADNLIAPLFAERGL